MAKPTVIPPGIPDATNDAGDTVSINTSVWFEEIVPPPPDEYELLFDFDSRHAARMDTPWIGADGCTIALTVIPVASTFTSVQVMCAQASNNSRLRVTTEGQLYYDYDYNSSGQSRTIYTENLLAGVEYNILITQTDTGVTVNVNGTDYSNSSPCYYPASGFEWLGSTAGAATSCNAVLKNWVLTGGASSDRNYAVDDGPGSTFLLDTVSGSNAALIDVVDSDWRLV